MLNIDAGLSATAHRHAVPPAALPAYSRSIYDAGSDTIICFTAASAVEHGKWIEYIDVARGASGEGYRGSVGGKPVSPPQAKRPGLGRGLLRWQISL